MAPQRKKDPGELFDWHKLARKNIGIWPENKHMKNNKNYTIKSMQQMLAHFGYEISISGKLDHQTKKVVSAFQRHFRPKKINGIFDDETIAKLLVLNRKK